MTLAKTARAFSAKYAQTSPEEQADALKKFKEKLQPWLDGSMRVLANIGSDLTPEVVNNANHPYNIADQSSGNILSTYNNVKKIMTDIYKNISHPNYSLKRLDQSLNNMAAMMASNPQYKTNPLFLLKKNTQYNFDECVKSMRALVKQQMTAAFAAPSIT